MMESFAHFLAFGPYHYDYPGSSDTPYPLHVLARELIPFYNHCRTDEDAFVRASSFFARAYTLQLPEPDQFAGIGFSDECRNTSITAIRELLEFYNSGLLRCIPGGPWDFHCAFSSVQSHMEWAMEERRWADKLKVACGLKSLQGLSNIAVESGIDNILGSQPAALHRAESHQDNRPC